MRTRRSPSRRHDTTLVTPGSSRVPERAPTTAQRVQRAVTARPSASGSIASAPSPATSVRPSARSRNVVSAGADVLDGRGEARQALRRRQVVGEARLRARRERHREAQAAAAHHPHARRAVAARERLVARDRRLRHRVGEGRDPLALERAEEPRLRRRELAEEPRRLLPLALAGDVRVVAAAEARRSRAGARRRGSPRAANARPRRTRRPGPRAARGAGRARPPGTRRSRRCRGS